MTHPMIIDDGSLTAADHHVREFLDDCAGRLECATVSAYEVDTRQFLAYLAGHGIHDLDQVTTDQVVDWVKTYTTAATRGRKLSTVKSLYVFWRTKGVDLGMPTDTASEKRADLPTDRIRVSPADMDLILSQARPGSREAVVMHMFAHGLAVSDLVRLQLAHVQLEHEVVVVDGRPLPLRGDAVEVIRQYLRGERAHAARRFITDPGVLLLNYRGQKLSRQALWKEFVNATTRAGFDNLRPLDFRYSVALQQLEAGGGCGEVAYLLGMTEWQAQRYVRAHAKGKKAHAAAAAV